MYSTLINSSGSARIDSFFCCCSNITIYLLFFWLIFKKKKTVEKKLSIFLFHSLFMIMVQHLNNKSEMHIITHRFRILNVNNQFDTITIIYKTLLCYCVCVCVWRRAQRPTWPCKPGCTHLAQHQAKQKRTWGFTTRLFVPEPHVTCSDTQGSNRASTAHDRPKHCTNNTSQCKRNLSMRNNHAAMQYGVRRSLYPIDRTYRLFIIYIENTFLIVVWKLWLAPIDYSQG